MYSRSATMRRRGKMPIEPSMTLMWTSITKGCMPSPSSSAVEKAINVGSVVLRISFMRVTYPVCHKTVERVVPPLRS